MDTNNNRRSYMMIRVPKDLHLKISDYAQKTDRTILATIKVAWEKFTETNK